MVLVNEFDKQDHWSMVLDNIENCRSDYTKFLPIRRGTRHVVITTRYREAHSVINGNPIDLENMTYGKASLLFSKV